VRTKFAEKIRENVVRLITLYPADHAVYKIMCFDTVERDSVQMTV